MISSMTSKYDIDEVQFLSLYSEGFGNREIARQLSIPHWVIGKRLKKFGLPSNVARGTPPEKIDAEHSRCSKCQGVFHNNDFPWVQGKADGRKLSYCRGCRTTQLRVNRYRSPETYFRDKTNRLRLNIKGIEFNLPMNHLLCLWEKQNGLCFYTDESLIISAGIGRSDWTASVDRMDNSVGYLEGNVVLCGNRVNSIKTDLSLGELEKWMPGWYQRIRAELGNF